MPEIRIPTNDLEWRASPHEGVTWKKLLHDKETGRSTVLLKFEPGAEYGEHVHPKGEEYFVLSGTLSDGDDIWGPGTYVRHLPGSSHKPRSDKGCELLVWMDAPIVDLEAG